MTLDILDVENSLERTIYERLRLKTLELGYIIDIETYDILNPDPEVIKSETIRYKEDLSKLTVEKGFSIEVFGAANNQARGTKKVPRIVVQSETFYEGELGLQIPDNIVKNDEGGYTLKESVSITSDWFFNIHLVANTIEQLRILRVILILALPRRGYIPWYEDKVLQKSHNLLCRYLTQYESDWEMEGIMEKIYRYTIPDIHIHDDIIIDNNIKPIKQIDWDLIGSDFEDNVIIE